MDFFFQYQYESSVLKKNLDEIYRVLDSPIVGFRWVDLCLFARIVMAGSMTATIWNYVNCLFNATYASVSFFFFFLCVFELMIFRLHILRILTPINLIVLSLDLHKKTTK